MKIEAKQISQLTIRDAPNLDPITVITEDMAPGKGKITISCCGRSWTSYWGAMGGTVSEFFQRCSNEYLAKNLEQGIRQGITDDKAIADHIRRNVIELRRSGDLEKHDARDLYDDASRWLSMETLWHWDRVSEVLGDDWWCRMPESPNPDYLYLCRIIDAVREGLQLDAAEQAQVAANTVTEVARGAREYNVEANGDKWLMGLDQYELMAVIKPATPSMLQVMDAEGEPLGTLPAHADADTVRRAVGMFNAGYQRGLCHGQDQVRHQLRALICAAPCHAEVGA